MHRLFTVTKNIDNLTTPTPYAFKNYGVERGKSFLNNLGILQLTFNYDKPLLKNGNLKWRYQAFATIGQKRFDKIGNQYKENALDHRLDAQLTAKFAKYFNVNLGLIGIFDKDQIDQIQLAQTINFGFLYAW